jgi:hypothetical protein
MIEKRDSHGKSNKRKFSSNAEENGQTTHEKNSCSRLSAKNLATLLRTSHMAAHTGTGQHDSFKVPRCNPALHGLD